MSIRFHQVTKSFGTKTVLKQVSFEVKPGEILFILGKSGVGKSVTLKHIIGLMKPDSGQVLIGNQEIARLSADELASIRRKCGMVFQHPALLDSLTIFDNISFGLKTPGYQRTLAHPLTQKEIRKIVLEKLSLVYLKEDILDRFPPEISYGMQKRVSIARTLAPGPEILLFDEPTTGLDPISTTAITDLIHELSRKLQVTSLVVSHDMGSALRIADRLLVLDGGQILALGSPTEIRASPLPLIRDFLSETLAEQTRP